MTPFANPDLWIYLGPGIRALAGEQFQECAGQCFLYPGFVYVLLRLGGSFRWIVLVQSVLSLAAAALLFCCWMRMRRLLPGARLPLLLFKLAGAVLAGAYLFSTATVEFERSLHPEAVFPFLVILQIYCNLCFIHRRFVQNRSGLLSGGAAFFLSIAALLAKPSFLGALVFANVPLIISLFHARQPARSKLLLIGVPVVVATLLLVWPERIFRGRDPTGSSYLAESLFGIHADLINTQMAEDLARHAATPYPPEFLAAIHVALTQALRESREGKGKYWPALGFYGDYVRFGMAGRRPFLCLLGERMGSEARAAAFCRYYYWRTVYGQPAGMAAKIARQLGVFYRFGGCPAYVTYHFFELSKLYQETTEALSEQPKLQCYPPLAAVIASSAALRDTALRIGPYMVTQPINRFLSKTHLLWFVWAILLAMCTWGNETLRTVFGLASPTLLLLYAYNFGTVLTLAIGHSLDVGRYSQYQFAYTLLPEFASMWLALETLMLIGPRRTSAPGKTQHFGPAASAPSASR